MFSTQSLQQFGEGGGISAEGVCVRYCTHNAAHCPRPRSAARVHCGKARRTGVVALVMCQISPERKKLLFPVLHTSVVKALPVLT